jgi:acetoin utilization deacetylase AcuC-like enzyme
VIIFHDPRCVEYSAPRHPERPARIITTVPVLRERHPKWEWRQPRAATDDELLRAHSREHLGKVASSKRDFDVDTPVYPKIDMHARQAAGAAIQAAEAALSQQRAFSLMRPPGHHAARDRAMGFCYYSNIAVAALHALESGSAESGSGSSAGGRCHKVAIWDFDAHHGNGTEAIVAHNERIRFASVHQHPAYPGTGAKSFANIDNYPVAPGTARGKHVRIARESLERLLEFKPDLLLVSAGFDAYARDPLVQMTLETEDFAAFGHWLGKVNLPTAAILEGGYSDDLPELIDAFLTAWSG